MKITIRTREIADGNRSIYLDCIDGKERWQEFLNLYLVPESSKDARRLNEAMMSKANEIKSRRMLGIKDEPSGDPKEKPRRVLAEWLDDFLLSVKNNPMYSDNTYKLRKYLVDIVKAYLASIHRPRLIMTKIDKKFALGFIDFLNNRHGNTKPGKDGKPLSPVTKEQHQNVFSRLLTRAVKEGLIDRNPFDLLSPKEKIHAPKTKKVYLDRDELNALTATPEPNTDTKAAFMFCCFTGLRYSDVKALTWRQISVVNGKQVLTIESMKKTGKPVMVPLNKSAMFWLPDRGDSKPYNQVFRLPSNSPCNALLKRLASAAGIKKNISFHTARHTFAVISIAAGGELLTVSRLMGHSSVESTQVYADVTPDTQLNAISRISDYFGH